MTGALMTAAMKVTRREAAGGERQQTASCCHCPPRLIAVAGYPFEFFIRGDGATAAGSTQHAATSKAKTHR